VAFEVAKTGLPGYDLHYYRNCCCDNSNCGLSFPAAKEPMGRLLISRYSIFQADLKICFTGKSKILIKSCAFL
jgi:hypothetical protein